MLFESASTVGGQLRIAGAGPTREELLDFVFYLERELERLEVDVRRGSRATAESVLGESPDLVVCATGATPQAPSFPVDGGARVVTVWDLLGGSVTDIPARAVVLDDGSGFWHGVSAAEYLAERGAEVELVTPARGIALAIPEESTATVLQRLRGNGVRFRTLTTVTGVSGANVALADVVNGEADATSAELVAVRTLLQVEDALARELDTRVPTFVIGDSAAPRCLTHAVLDANLAIRRLDAGTLPETATALVAP